MNMKLRSSALLTLSIQLAFASASALANPSGAQVAAGSASFAQPSAGKLVITNSPGAIINWQNFSIGAGEVTQFVQTSSSSTVLNRVVSTQTSQLFGTLQSNGKVFLINPNGILIGAGAVVDTAGFVASTLNLSDAEFMANKLRFLAGPDAAPISNHGLIRARGDGSVVLVAPNIENTGIIQTESGQLILAAGRKISIGSLDQGGVEFEVQAPGDSVLNLGKLIAERGAVQVFASRLTHSGEIRAASLTRNVDGDIVLAARDGLTVSAGSVTRADGASGGRILLQAAAGTAEVAGVVSARGSEGKGGDVRVLGNEVNITGSAELDASGSTGGGSVLVGGDFQGANAAVQNAHATNVAAGARISADAGTSGDGGKVVVWADDTTRYAGRISARGGSTAGNGGNVEVSGKKALAYTGQVDLSAPFGTIGNLLLDPLDLYLFAGAALLLQAADEIADYPDNVVAIDPAALTAANANVTLFAGRDMFFMSPVALTAAGAGLTATAGRSLEVSATITTNNGPVNLTSGTGALYLDYGVHINTGGGAVTLTSTNSSISGSSSAQINSGGGAVTLATPNSNIYLPYTQINTAGGDLVADGKFGIYLGPTTTSGGKVDVSAPNGTVNFYGDVTTGGGLIDATGANVQLSNYYITLNSGGAPITITTTGSIYDYYNNTIDSGGGNIQLTSSGGAIDLYDTTLLAGVGTVTANANNYVYLGGVTASALSATATNSYMYLNSVTATGAVSLTAASDITTGNIATPGTVSLTTTSSGGDIVTTIDDASSANLMAGGNILAALNNVGLVSATAGSARTIELSGGNLTFGTISAPGGSVELDGAAILMNNGSSSIMAPTVEMRATGAIGSQSLPIALRTTNDLIVEAGNAFNLASDTALQGLSLFVNASNMGANSAVTAPGLTLNLSASGSTLTLANFASANPMSGPFELQNLGGDLVVTSAAMPASSNGQMVFGGNNVTIGSITNGGNGGIVISASGNVAAAANNAGVELEGNNGVVSVSGANIGDASNPFDIHAASIYLTSIGGDIGTNAARVHADTPYLVVFADGRFAIDVSPQGASGPRTLNYLEVNASAASMGANTSTVTGANATYTFTSNGTDFTQLQTGANQFTVPAGELTQGFAFTARDGSIATGSTNFNTAASSGELQLMAEFGSISVGTLTLGSGGAMITSTAGVSTDDIVSLGTVALSVSGASTGSVQTGNINTSQSGSQVRLNAGHGGGNVSFGDVDVGLGQFIVNTSAYGATLGTVTGADINAGYININDSAYSSQYGAVSLGALSASNYIFLNVGNYSTFGPVTTASITTPLLSLNTSTTSTFNTVAVGPISRGAAPSATFSIHASGSPFQLNSIDAGTGNVIIESSAGIQQVAGTLNATTVTLKASAGPISGVSGGPLMTGGVKNLIVDAGGMFSLQNNDDFVSLNLTQRSATSPFVLSGMLNQTVTVTADPLGVDLVALNGNAVAGMQFRYSNLDPTAGKGGIDGINIDTKGTAAVGGPVTLDAANVLGNPAAFSILTGGQSVNLSGTQGVQISNLSGVGFANLQSSSGAVSLNNFTNTAGLSISGATGVTHGAIDAGPGSLQIFGGAGSIVGTSINRTGTAFLNISNNSFNGGSISYSGPIVTGGSMTIDGRTGVSYNTINGGSGTISLIGRSGNVSGGAITQSSGSILLTSQNGMVSLSGAVTTNGSLQFNGSQGISFTSLSTGGSGQVFLSTASGSIAGTSINTTGLVNLAATNGGIGSLATPIAINGAGTHQLVLYSNSPFFVTDTNNLSSLLIDVRGTAPSGTFMLTAPNLVGFGLSGDGTNLTLTGASGTGANPLSSLNIASQANLVLYGDYSNVSAIDIAVNTFGRNLTVGAIGGVPTLLQSSSSLRLSSGGALMFIGGAGSGESVTVKSTGSYVQLTANQGILGQGGSGANSAILVSGANQLYLNGSSGVNLTAGSGSGSSVTFENTSGSQTVYGTTLTLSNALAGGDVLLKSGGSQLIDVGNVIVRTLPGADATSIAAITASGQQDFYLYAPVGGLVLDVEALGLGTAKIQSGGNQTVTVSDFFAPSGVLVGSLGALGQSLISSAADQTFTIGSMTVQGGAGTNATAKVAAVNKQIISALAGDVNVFGGSGSGAAASIDPAVQGIFALNQVNVVGGSGNQAVASVSSTGTTSIGAPTVTTAPGSGTGADGVGAADAIVVDTNTCQGCDTGVLGVTSRRVNGSSTAAPPPGGSTTPAEEAQLDPTPILLALTERSVDVVEDSGPSQSTAPLQDEGKPGDDDKKKRRAGQCR